MRSFQMFCLLFSLLLLCLIRPVQNMSPYSVLHISETASLEEIEDQYKRLRSKHRRSRSKKHMLKQAYNKILFERQFDAKEEVEAARPTIQKPITQHIDQAYVYGYKLRDEYDDGRYFEMTFN